MSEQIFSDAVKRAGLVSQWESLARRFSECDEQAGFLKRCAIEEQAGLLLVAMVKDRRLPLPELAELVAWYEQEEESSEPSKRAVLVRCPSNVWGQFVGNSRIGVVNNGGTLILDAYTSGGILPQLDSNFTPIPFHLQRECCNHYEAACRLLAEYVRRSGDRVEDDTASDGKGEQTIKPTEAMLSVQKLAKLYGLDPEATRKRLERYRQRNHNGWTQVEKPKRNEPQYLYHHSTVHNLLENAKDRAETNRIRRTKTSDKRPTGKIFRQ